MTGTAARTGSGSSKTCGSASVQPGSIVALGLLLVVLVERVVRAETLAVGALNAAL